jgi:hypothetical protein
LQTVQGFISKSDALLARKSAALNSGIAGSFMNRVLAILIGLAFAMNGFAQSGAGKEAAPGHYLFAWTGDQAKKGNDFLAVINADPKSPAYGKLVTTLVTDQQTRQVHHTEYAMPPSRMLFANDHGAGRSFIFDLRDPLHPNLAHSFGDMAGYGHPHSYLRLPNGHVLVTFQHDHRQEDVAAGPTGGLVEIDEDGKVVRASSSADTTFPGALLMPYSLVVLADLDRVVSTNSSMDPMQVFGGLTYQIWRLSDLKLLKTAYFDEGPTHIGQTSPEEPRRGPDGSVFVQTVACGVERITGIETASPQSQLVYRFPGVYCGVPTIVGHYFIQSVPAINGLIVLDIATANAPKEVARLKLSDAMIPHWTGWDAKTQRLVVTGYEEARLYMLKFDQVTGQVEVDSAFRDDDGKPGFNFADRTWPHGWKGTGVPHGVVFSLP